MDNKKPEQYLILTDAWKCIKKYLNADLSKDETWEEIIRTFDDAYKLHTSEFARAIYVECVNELERIWNEQNAKGCNINRN